MQGQIRISPEQMRGRASDFRRQGADFESVIKAMEGLIGVLRDEWEGQASQKFAEQFERLKPSFLEVRQLIDDIGGQCDGTADALEALDNEIAGKFA
jgi:WXG100 family type VII secretion target